PTPRRSPTSTLFPYTTLFRSSAHDAFQGHAAHIIEWPTMLRPKDSEGTCIPSGVPTFLQTASRRNPSADYDGSSVALGRAPGRQDRKSTRLNSSHLGISYAVF